jgi:hypothetical protein
MKTSVNGVVIALIALHEWLEVLCLTIRVTRTTFGTKLIVVRFTDNLCLDYWPARCGVTQTWLVGCFGSPAPNSGTRR